jgi:hypothetical protein
MAAEPTDCGQPIAYLVLQNGTAVYASDRSTIGTVEHVLFVVEEDIFEGIVVETHEGLRFVDRDDVDRIFERCVLTTLTAEQARALPPPESGAPVYDVDPADGAGPSLHDHYRRLFGKAHWHEEKPKP